MSLTRAMMRLMKTSSLGVAGSSGCTLPGRRHRPIAREVAATPVAHRDNLRRQSLSESSGLLPCLNVLLGCATRAASRSAGHDSPSSTSSCFHVFVLTPYRRAVVYTSMLHHCICCFAVVLYRYIHIIPASSHSRHTHRISPAGDGRYPAEYPPDAACLFPLILPPVPRTLPAHDLPYAPLYDHHVSSRCRSRDLSAAQASCRLAAWTTHRVRRK